MVIMGKGRTYEPETCAVPSAALWRNQQEGPLLKNSSTW